jgi:tRNA(fMet)-specific endonuclease VapC
MRPSDRDVESGRGHSRTSVSVPAIGALDTLIAAHALSLGAVAVTNNVREFARFTGLAVEDWTTD